MVCRQQEEKDESIRKKNYKLSIQLATRACELDMKDSYSWCKYHLPSFNSGCRCFRQRSHDKLFLKQRKGYGTRTCSQSIFISGKDIEGAQSRPFL